MIIAIFKIPEFLFSEMGMEYHGFFCGNLRMSMDSEGRVRILNVDEMKINREYEQWILSCIKDCTEYHQFIDNMLYYRGG